jgi:hypothetical protein
MHRRRAPRTATRALTHAALLAALLIGAAACGSDEDDADTRTGTTTTAGGDAEARPAGDDDHDDADDEHDGDGDHPEAPGGAEEIDAPVVRLAVADPTTGALALVDVDAPDDATTLELAAPATGATTTEDGRFVVVRHEDAVTVVDGGTWAEGHGDHDHHFVGEPAVVGEVAGDHPSHLISHDERLALFFDGTGEAIVLDEDALVEGQVEEVGHVHAAAPHHGFALPVDDGYVLTDPAGAPDGELPEAVAVADEEGAVAETFPCAATHGEAAIDDGAAAACGDGVLLLQRDDETWGSTTVAYPAVEDADPYGEATPRAWSLQASEEGDALVGVLGGRHLVRIDVEAATADAVDVGAPIAGKGLALLDDGVTAAVLSTDGVLRLVDTATGTVAAEVPVLDAFEEGEDDVADRQVVVAGERAWVTDPTTSTAVAVDLGAAPAVTGTLDLPVVPGAVQVVGV